MNASLIATEVAMATAGRGGRWPSGRRFRGYIYPLSIW